ncbi:cobalamin-independent methionine synthase II family protein [Spirillospora sp. NBC_00431]
MTHRYPAQVIGSLLRPSYLMEARNSFANGEASATDLKQAEDRAVDQLIGMQEAAGLDIITDGEMRRSVYFGPLVDAVDGIDRVESQVLPFRDQSGPNPVDIRTAITGKMKRRHSVVAEEYVYARARARKPLKVTVPSPMMVWTVWSAQHSTGAYSDPFEACADAVDVIRAEVLELARLGCTYIQVDAAETGALVDPRIQEWSASVQGMSAERMLTEGVEMIDACVADVPGVHFGLHLCRGNAPGVWLSEGGYDEIASEVFSRTPHFDTYLLEYDDDRSGSFQALSAVPDDKQVVLGLVSSKREELESAESLHSRISEAGKYFPQEQMALSTQCGFASGIDGNPISDRTQEAKLRRVAEVAHSVWN